VVRKDVFQLQLINVTNEEELSEAFRIRKAVFVEEQKVPLEDEFDQHDALARHVLVIWENQSVATGRLRVISDIAKLERICVLADWRQKGLGRVIVRGLEAIAEKEGLKKFKLHAQTHAIGFYNTLGYEASSPEFMEDGIPHVVMLKNPD